MTAIQKTESIVRTLQANTANLPPSQMEFAGSLASQWFRKNRLSDKQWYWVNKLAAQATTPATPAPTEQIADDIDAFAPMVAMFEKAKGHLKFPKTLILTASRERDGQQRKDRGEHFHDHDLKGRTLRLYVAGDRAKFPGSITVLDAESRDWLGRVTKDGAFTASRKLDDADRADVADGLRAFASDPEQAAKAYGRLLGSCCFCNTELTDGRSTAVGYGPVCAKNYGLPWGA